MSRQQRCLNCTPHTHTHLTIRPCVLSTQMWYNILSSLLRSHTWATNFLSPLLSLTGDPSICSISNPDFVLYSSVVSFYLPFGVTVLVYARIYVVLRQRRRKRFLTRQNSQCLSVRPGFPQQVSTLEEQKEDSTQPRGLSALCPVVRDFACSTHWGHM